MFRIGILGDSLSQYNPVTLSPMGAENEDEDNEGEDGEQKPTDDATTDKPQAGKLIFISFVKQIQTGQLMLLSFCQ